MPNAKPVSVSEASSLLNIPKRTIQYAITKGELQAHKLPGLTGAFLIDPADLHQWVAARTRATA